MRQNILLPYLGLKKRQICYIKGARYRITYDEEAAASPAKRIRREDQMANRTLYVTDLDKTLMRNDLSVSEYTVRTLNDLIDRGVNITYATARSFHSAYEITKDIKFKVPVITRTGTTFADQRAGKEIRTAFFTEENLKELKELLPVIARCGFNSVYRDGVMYKLYIDSPKSKGMQGYIDYYRSIGDTRMKQAANEDELWSGDISYITMISDRDELLPYYNAIKDSDRWECIFQKDAYREDEYWLEVCPKDATKAKAVLKLKEMLGCDNIVVFGDSLNDLSMFDIADVSCAVSNAMDEVKTAADTIIGSNEDDGVALWLLENAAVN